MAQLNPSNIQNGNIIQANDVLQLYDALTSGGGYNVSISGSLTGSATSASYALSASFATSASFAISSSRAISSSFAITASHALNAGTPNIVNVDTATGFNTPIGTQGLNIFAGITNLFPGSSPNSQSVSFSLAFPSLTPPVVGFGTDIWINATPTTGDVKIAQPIYVDYNIASKVIHFITEDPGFNGNVIYTGYTKV
jgi:hypothetical protein